jgi:hypothetical protein
MSNVNTNLLLQIQSTLIIRIFDKNHIYKNNVEVTIIFLKKVCNYY